MYNSIQKYFFRVRVVSIALLCMLITGCGGMAFFNAGIAVVPGEKPKFSRESATLNAHIDLGGKLVYLGWAMRGKFASNFQHVAGGPEVLLKFSPARFLLYGRAGINLIQFENLGGDFAWGLGSPFLGVGLGYGMTKSLYLVLSGTGEYDIRLNNEKNSFNLAAFLGLALKLG